MVRYRVTTGLRKFTHRITRKDRITYWVTNVRLLASCIETDACLQNFIFSPPKYGDRNHQRQRNFCSLQV